ncbi:MAG TPA: NAD-dependent epimerase/dehydratase family protein [Thermoanaerobaculia bacterium]
MKILLTGATGFTGSYVLRRLLAEGLSPRCLVRQKTVEGVETVVGDIGDAASLARAFEGIDTLINTASLGFGHAPVLVEAAERAGVRRAIFLSTTSLFTSLNSTSKSIRRAAEETIQRSSLDWTILRPTMIYGSARDRNMIRLIRFVQRWPLLPVFGDGSHLQQPVYVDDVAAAVVLALRSDAAVRRAYNISGAAPLTFNQVLETVARLLGRRVRKVHVPAKPVVKSLQWVERRGLRFPVKAEQILRLNENKAFDWAEAARDFGYAPLPFEEGMRREIESLKQER